MIVFLITFLIVGVLTAALTFGTLGIKKIRDRKIKDGKLKEEIFHKGVNHYNYLAIFFLISAIMFTISYIVYFALDGTFSDGIVKNLYAGGVIFGVGSIIVGALCELINAGVLKFFELINKSKIDNDDKLTRNEEKTIGIIVLAMLTVLLYSSEKYVESYMCIAMIISYFSWVIPNWNEIKQSVKDLGEIGEDTIFSIGIVIIITFTLLKVGATPNIIAGLILGISVNLLIMVWVITDIDRKTTLDK